MSKSKPHKPPKFLNDQQSEAYDCIKKFVKGKEWDKGVKHLTRINPHIKTDPNKILLLGEAGVGKTWIASEVCKELLRDKKFKIISVAYSHQAVDNLRNAMSNLSHFSNLEFKTLSSLYKLRPDYDKSGNLEYRPSKDTPKLFTYKIDLLIIDEASQYGKLLKDCEIFLHPETKVLYMGDRCQTPPIGERNSPVFDLVAGIEMNMPVRYDKFIGDPARDLRKCIIEGGNDIRVKYIPKRTFREDSGGISHMKNIGFFKSLAEDLKNDPYNTKVICYTHAEMYNINVKLKAKINPSTTPVSEGDMLLTYGPYTPHTDGAYTGKAYEWRDIKNSETLKVQEHVNYEEITFDLKDAFSHIMDYDLPSPITIPFSTVKVENRAYDIPIVFQSEQIKRLDNFRKEIAKIYNMLWKNMIPLNVSEYDARHIVKEYLKNFDSTFLNAKLGYALTVYKAQGLGFNNVYGYIIDLERLVGKSEDQYDLYLKQLYTIITRSKNKCTITV